MAAWRDIVRSTGERLTRLKPSRIRTSHWFMGLAVALLLVIVAALYVWWGSIQEALHDPGIPYQTYTPPPAPDYARAESWALIPAHPATWTAKDPPADVFFIHPTTYERRAQWNGPIDDRRAVRLLDEVMIPNYAGPFAKAGRLFAPRYRQASLYTQLTLREDARDARAFAYRDVKWAFDFYLAHYNKGRPVIIAGVEQGGFLAERLAREVAGDPAHGARVVAVYLIETPVSADALPLPACTARAQAGCTVAWIGEGFHEAERTADRLKHAAVWRGDALEALAGRPTVCVNPLLGKASNQAAPARLNIGAVNAAGLEWGVRPGFQNSQVSAQCVDGVLKISRPKSPALRQRGGWLEAQRVRSANLFYADIEADAAARVGALLGLPGFGQLAPPLDGVVEIGRSPVHRTR
jgi:hypothetical protein